MTENKKCTVLQIGSYFLGTRLFSILHKKLNENGIESFTYSPCSDKTFRGWEMNDDDYKNVVISNCFKQRDRLFFFKKANKVFKDIEQRYNLKRFTCVYAHSVFSAGYPAFLLKKKYNIPYAVSVCNCDVNTFFKYCFWLRGLGEKIMLEAERVIFVSPAYKDFVSEKYVSKKNRSDFISKCVTIPFGIDEFWFNETESKTLNDKNKITIVTTGRVEPNKNQLSVAKACKLLNEKGYSVEYKLIGKVTDKEYCNNILSYGFCKSYGEKTYEEMCDIYKKCDIFVLSSIHETFGLVYGEAMSRGLPIIYSKGQGFDRQFSDGTVGFSVHSEDYKEIAVYIEKVISDYEKLSSKASLLCRKFDWNDIVKDYIAVFEKINP